MRSVIRGQPLPPDDRPGPVWAFVFATFLCLLAGAAAYGLAWLVGWA